MEPAVAFGKVLRVLRLTAGLTQEQLGFESDLRRTYVSILELGQQQPTLTTILKLAKALNRSANEMVGLVEAELEKSETPSGPLTITPVRIASWTGRPARPNDPADHLPVGLSEWRGLKATGSIETRAMTYK